MRKVFVIGLDGATFDVIQPLIDEGRLPTIARLMHEGTWGELESTIPPLSPPAWASFLTGKNPGKHGVFDFQIRRQGGQGGGVVNSSSIRARKLWQLTGSDRGRVALVGVPMTYPPEPVNGCLISGIPAPAEGFPFTWPPELRHEILEHCGDYFHERRMIREMAHAAGFRALFRHTEARKEAVLHLMRTRDWDFSMVVFRAPDIVQHYALRFWGKAAHPLRDLVTKCYEHVDAALGELLRELPSDLHIIIMSDHGARAAERIFYLNRWLAEERYLRLKSFRRWRGLRRGRRNYSVATLLRRLNLRLVLSRLPASWRTRRITIPFRREMDAWIDWSGTRACAPLGGLAEAIDINLKGREPYGSVSAEEYDLMREKIARGLGSVHDPDTGENLDIIATKREDAYEGPFTSGAHDLIIEFGNPTYCAAGSIGGAEVFGTPRYVSGQHTKKGVLLLRGPHIRPETRITGAHLTDLLPTILYLLGHPIPDDLDGRVLQDAIDADHYRREPPRFERAAPGEPEKGERPGVFSPEEEAKIRSDLAALGYL